MLLTRRNTLVVLGALIALVSACASAQPGRVLDPLASLPPPPTTLPAVTLAPPPPPSALATPAPPTAQGGQARTITPGSLLALAPVLPTFTPFFSVGTVIIVPATPYPPGYTPTFPTPIPTPTRAPRLPPEPIELRYRLIDAFGGISQLNPDPHGIVYCREPMWASGEPPGLDPQVRADQQMADLAQHPELLAPILKRLGLRDSVNLSAQDKQRIYDEITDLRSIGLTPTTDGYRFEVYVYDAGVIWLVLGVITSDGQVTLTGKRRSFLECPICLAEDTRIDTPLGKVRVQEVQVGMGVWSVDGAGQRVAAPVRQVTRVPIPPGHEFVDLRLSDGRRLLASPGHPLADGRRLGDLTLGDTVGDAQVVGVERRPARSEATYDLLPDSATGQYWADGVLLGSTLRLPTPRVDAK